MSTLLKNNDYKKWLVELKAAIKQQQIKAALAVNSQLIMLYWDMGRQIVDKQEHAKWGTGFINQLSKDLKAEFPDMGGFSVSNLKYCKQFYLYYKVFLIGQQAVGQLKISGIKKSQQAVGFLGKGRYLKAKQPVLQLKKVPPKKRTSLFRKMLSKKQQFRFKGKQLPILSIFPGGTIFLLFKK